VQSCTPGGTTPETVPARQDVGSLSAEWIEQNNQHVLHFEAEFPDAETIDQPIWGGLEFFDPSRPVSDEHGDYVFAGMGNIQFGFFAGEGVSTPNFNYVDSDGSWQTESNPGYSVSAEDNRILVDVPSHLVPPGGTYFFYTDDGSNCDSVGLEPDGPVGAIPPGGPIVIFDLTVGSDEPAVATFNDFSGDAKFCQTDSFVEDLGVDIDRVEFEYDPTVPGGWVRVDVITGDPGPASLDNFSFATIIDLTLGVESQKTFVFNHHDEITDAGELDPDSGNLIESNAQIDISEDVSLGKPGTMVSFEIPFLDFPSQVDGVRVFTYRTLMEGDSKLCDDVIIFIQPVIVQDPAAMDE
jgi:hypothetical protein